MNEQARRHARPLEAPRPLSRVRLAAWLRAASRGTFYTLLVLMPLSIRWVIVPRNAFGLQPEYISTLFYLLDIPLLLLLAGWLLSHLVAPTPGRGWRVAWPLVAPLVAVVALSLASVLWSLALPVTATAALRQLLLLALFLFIVNEIDDHRRVARFLGVGALIQGAVAVLQFSLQRPLGLFSLGEMLFYRFTPGASLIQAGGERWLRAYGLSPSPNMVGEYLAIALLALLGWGLSGHAGRRAPWLGAVALVAAGLLATFSRASWLGLAVGLGLVAVVLRHAAPAGRAQGLRFAAVGLGAGVAFLVLYPQLFAARFGVLAPAPPSSSVLEQGLEGRDLAQRASHQRAAWQVILAQPLTGVGLGGSPLAASLLAPPELGERSHQPVHNIPLLLTAEVGVAGGALWLLLWGILFLGVWQGRKALSHDPWWLVWSAAALAMATFSLFDHSLLTYQQGRTLLWVVLGLWASAAHGVVMWRWPLLPQEKAAVAAPTTTRLAWLGFAALLPLVGLVGLLIWRYLAAPRGPLFWDPATFALSGLTTYQGIATQQWQALATYLAQQSTYPPGHPLLLAAWFAGVDATAASARLFSIVALSLATVGLYWGGWMMADDRAHARWSAWLAPLLFLSAPTVLFTASDALLEAPGAALVVGSLLAALRFLQRERRGWLLLSGTLATLAFFVKYNYGLPLLATLWLLALFRPSSPTRDRDLLALALSTVLPALLWFGSDGGARLAAFLTFALNRTTDLSVPAGLLFYPRALLHDFAPHWLLGLLLLAALLSVTRRYGEPRTQLLLLFLALTLLPALAHPYKQARFLSTAFPAITLLAAAEGARVLVRARARGYPRRVTVALLGAGLLAVVAAPLQLRGYQRGDNERLNVDPTARTVVSGMLEMIIEEVDPAAGVLVNGAFNEWSEPLLRWQWRLRERPVTRVASLPYLDLPGRSGREVGDTGRYERELARALAAQRPAMVVDVRVAPGSHFSTPDYDAWNRWQEAYSSAMERSPALRLHRRDWFDQGTIQLSIYCFPAGEGRCE